MLALVAGIGLVLGLGPCSRLSSAPGLRALPAGQGVPFDEAPASAARRWEAFGAGGRADHAAPLRWDVLVASAAALGLGLLAALPASRLAPRTRRARLAAGPALLMGLADLAEDGALALQLRAWPEVAPWTVTAAGVATRVKLAALRVAIATLLVLLGLLALRASRRARAMPRD